MPSSGDRAYESVATLVQILDSIENQSDSLGY